jgi:predicted  nucleic acid-binding Zn-ribbon protein
MELMLENKDIQKLKKLLITKSDLKKLLTKKDFEKFSVKAIQTFATKEEINQLRKNFEKFSVKAIQTFATKEEINQLRKEVSLLKDAVENLTLSVDKLVKAVEGLRQEYLVIKFQLDRHEKWIKQIAEKLGMKLEP